MPALGFTNATLTATVPYTVPTAPSGLTATAVSTSQINLSWTNNAIPIDVSGIQIDQATSSDFNQGLTTTTVAANATSYSFTGLSAGTTYYYRVRAINPLYSSANSTSAAAMTAIVGPTVAVTVPDGNFASDTPGYSFSTGGGNSGGTFTSPLTGTLSGWSLSAAPSTAQGGQYDAGGWLMYGVVDSVTSGSYPTSPDSNFAYGLGNQPGSAYNDFTYFPGEQYNSGGDIENGPQPGASLTMTTTGIAATAVAGSIYTATIEYANVSWGGSNPERER